MPKTATSALQVLLSPYGEIVLSRASQGKHLSPDGVRARYAEFFERCIPYEEFVSFGVVRDPVSWLLSWYNFRARKKLSNPLHPNHSNYTGNIGFSEFVEEFFSRHPRSFAKLTNQSQFYGFDGKRVNVTCLLRHSQLSDDMRVLTEVIPADCVRLLSNLKVNVSHATLATSAVEPWMVAKINSGLECDVELYRRFGGATAASVRRPAWLGSRSRHLTWFFDTRYPRDRLITIGNKISARLQRFRASPA